MTPDPTVTRPQADAIASLLRTLRPGWDQLATLNAVAAASHGRDLADLVHGCIRSAQDTAVRTPAMLGGLSGQHWTVTVRDGETAAEARARADRQAEELAEVQRERHQLSEDQRVAAAREEAKAALRAAMDRVPPWKAAQMAADERQESVA